jgi:colanic acid/amylovoran biosynthesis glycosyltransferase
MTEDQNQEGVPNSMLEAMATGLPVLATLHGGIPEAVRDGRSGLLVKERDRDALFAAMSALTDQPQTWETMGKAASAQVHEDFESHTQIEKLESAYGEAMSLKQHG